MECPHCGYEDGWNGDKCENVKGLKGEFYQPSNNIVMQRPGEYGDGKQEKELYGCPNCNKLFMGY